MTIIQNCMKGLYPAVSASGVEALVVCMAILLRSSIVVCTTCINYTHRVVVTGDTVEAFELK